MDIVFDSLTIGYNHPLASVDYDVIYPVCGKLWALQGPNGSGKTTFLKTLANIIPPRSGTFSISPSTTSIRFLPDTLLFPESTTIDDIIGTGPNLSQARALVTNLKIPQDTPWGRMSWGNRRKTAIAYSISRISDEDSHLILWDEPFSGLDDDSISQVISFLQECVLTSKTIMLLSAHGCPVLNNITHHLFQITASQDGFLIS